jgi:hypothetical protein
MSTYTETQAQTFTIAHARMLASKVATDLKKFQRFYGSPSDAAINDYEAELAVMLKYDAVTNVTYGFQRDGKWTEASVKYTAVNGNLSSNDDPGKIRPGIDVAGATFTSFLEWNFHNFTEAEKEAIRQECPFRRTTGNTPPLEAGYWAEDLNYAAGGRGLGRATVKK